MARNRAESRSSHRDLSDSSTRSSPLPETKKRNQTLGISWSPADRIGDALRVVPLDPAIDILDLLELLAQLDDGEADHPGVETECSSDSLLHGAR